MAIARMQQLGDREIHDVLTGREMVTVDRCRLERLLTIADVLAEHWPSVRLYAERYIAHDEMHDVDAIEAALVALHPRDRDPLP